MHYIDRTERDLSIVNSHLHFTYNLISIGESVWKFCNHALTNNRKCRRIDLRIT